MNLIVDIGNTLVKLAVFEQGRLVSQRSTHCLEVSDFERLLQGRRADRAIVESTCGDADEIVEVYTLGGIKVRTAKRKDALRGLKPDYYIVK